MGILVVAGVGTAVAIRWAVVAIVDDRDSNASAAVFRMLVIAAVAAVFIWVLLTLVRGAKEAPGSTRSGRHDGPVGSGPDRRGRP